MEYEHTYEGEQHIEQGPSGGTHHELEICDTRSEPDMFGSFAESFLDSVTGGPVLTLPQIEEPQIEEPEPPTPPHAQTSSSASREGAMGRPSFQTGAGVTKGKKANTVMKQSLTYGTVAPGQPGRAFRQKDKTLMMQLTEAQSLNDLWAEVRLLMATGVQADFVSLLSSMALCAHWPRLGQRP